jgi:hypothetical protein
VTAEQMFTSTSDGKFGIMKDSQFSACNSH